ncbi:MAG TPA: CATRA system-associated protein [Micromonosporaceae bacterium]|nr:CATRA system-associated protein [Micromonosporaceae bacterium]
MTTPHRFRAVATWTAHVIERAHTWSWDDRTLVEYAAVLDRIDHAVETGDPDALYTAYQALVTLDSRTTRFGSRADHPAPADDRYPYQRTNELVHRLRSISGTQDTTPADNAAGKPTGNEDGARDPAS